MAEVAAVAEVHTHELIARLKHCHEYGHIGLCARVRLHVYPFGIEQTHGAFFGYIFGLIYLLAAAVVALGRISLGIFVGHA